MGDKSNVAKPLPLRQDLMQTYKRAALLGWVVSLVLLIAVIALIVFIALRPAPLAGVDENGFVVGQVVFDEPRLRSGEEILADMKNFVRRCMTTNKQTVWEDMAVCVNHLEPTLAEKRISVYEETGELLKIEAYGCERVEFSFDTKGTGLTRHDRGDYIAEGLLTGSVACNDTKNPQFKEFKVKLTALLTPKTDKKPLGLQVYSYEDI